MVPTIKLKPNRVANSQEPIVSEPESRLAYLLPKLKEPRHIPEAFAKMLRIPSLSFNASVVGHDDTTAKDPDQSIVVREIDMSLLLKTPDKNYAKLRRSSIASRKSIIGR